MEKLVKNRGNILKVEVNDEGECIAINLADAEFPHRFYTLYQNVEKRLKEFEDSKLTMENESETVQLEYVRKLNQGNAEDIDNLFGTDTCKKVFGVVPDIYAVIDFFEEILPIIEKATKNRNKTIKNKYSPNRRGRR